MSTVPSQTYLGPAILGGGSHTTQLVGVSEFASLNIHVKCNTDVNIIPLWTDFNSGYESAGETLAYNASENPSGQVFQIAVANSQFHYKIDVPGSTTADPILVATYGAFFPTSPSSSSTSSFVPEFLNYCISDEFSGPPDSFDVTTSYTTFTPFTGSGAAFFSSQARGGSDWVSAGLPAYGGLYLGPNPTIYSAEWGCVCDTNGNTNVLTFQMVKFPAGGGPAGGGSPTVYPFTRLRQRVSQGSSGSFGGGAWITSFENLESFGLQVKATEVDEIHIHYFYFNLIKVG